MNTDLLFSMIDKEIDIFNIKVLLIKEELNYINKLLSKNSIYELENINVVDILILGLILESSELTYEEIEKHVLKNIDLVKYTNINLLEHVKTIFENSRVKANSNIFKNKIVDLESLKILQDNNKNNSIFDIFYSMTCIEKVKDELIKCNDSVKVNKGIINLDYNKTMLISISLEIYSVIDILKNILGKSKEYAQELKDIIKKLNNVISKYNKAKTILSDTDLDKTILTEVWIKIFYH